MNERKQYAVSIVTAANDVFYGGFKLHLFIIEASNKDEALGYALPKCIDENNKIETYCILKVED